MKVIQKLVMLVVLMGSLQLGAGADDDNQNGGEKMVYSISDRLAIEKKLLNNKEKREREKRKEIARWVFLAV